MTDILVCDRVEYGLDCFGRKPQTWRVEMHLKRVEDHLNTWKPSADDIGGKIIRELCMESRQNERRRRKRRGLPHARRYRLIYCKPEEATHVSLVSICGATAPLSECKRLGTVEWTPEHIAERRASAVSDFWLANNFPADWRWE